MITWQPLLVLFSVIMNQLMDTRGMLLVLVFHSSEAIKFW